MLFFYFFIFFRFGCELWWIIFIVNWEKRYRKQRRDAHSCIRWLELLVVLKQSVEAEEVEWWNMAMVQKKDEKMEGEGREKERSY